MRLTWLADVLRDAGCKVVEHPGWQDRGKELAAVHGVVWHHTASGPSTPDSAVARLLIIGRPDLPGPLCQLGLSRDGTFHVVAAGKGNHNGYGTWGNQAVGIEAYNNGVGEAWPPVQLAAYDRGTAAICRRLGLTSANVKGHKETDPGRKIDPAGIDMDQARQRVAALITYTPPAPAPKGPLMALSDKEQAELLTKTREIHRELTSSADGSSPKGASLLWRVRRIGEKVGAWPKGT